MTGRLRRAASDPLLGSYSGAFGAAGSTPRVAVFVGSGASHSWIWFADLTERIGLYDVAFIDERDIAGGALRGFDFILFGGGDTYEIAGCLGGRGARALEDFVVSGGLYFGSCAGAYLVLSGVDLEPFTPFRLVDGWMVNVMRDPPAPRCLHHKYLAPYGDQWVFHPVYGEVELSPVASPNRFNCFGSGGPLGAPLYGGPVLAAGRGDEVVAEFSGLTSRAAYTWPRSEAAAVVTGRPAVICARRGRGTAVVSGPHLEHPMFPEANALAAELFLRHWQENHRRIQVTSHRTPSGRGTTSETSEILYAMKREISNARIVGFGLEKMPVTWRIGVKVWEPEKIRMFLDYAWNRLPYLEARAHGAGGCDDLQRLASGYAGVTDLTRSLKMRIESGKDSTAEAKSLLTTLKELTADFLSLYFRLRLEERDG